MSFTVSFIFVLFQHLLYHKCRERDGIMNMENLQRIQKELPAHVTLIAVSKTRTKEEIDEAFAAGCSIFGENKVQEITAKYDERYHWHMIGHLQRNKVKQVLPYVDMIQSLDSLPLAKEIEKQAGKLEKTIPVLVEVNISQEENKTGLLKEDVLSFVETCKKDFPHIDIQGLMCVGPNTDDQKHIEDCFEQVHQLFLQAQDLYGDSIRWLSMGMSADWKLAVAHGSNMVRIGSDIFGPRNYNK